VQPGKDARTEGHGFVPASKSRIAADYIGGPGRWQADRTP
jgi:hypothetical protein